MDRKFCGECHCELAGSFLFDLSISSLPAVFQHRCVGQIGDCIRRASRHRQDTDVARRGVASGKYPTRTHARAEELKTRVDREERAGVGVGSWEEEADLKLDFG